MIEEQPDESIEITQETGFKPGAIGHKAFILIAAAFAIGFFLGRFASPATTLTTIFRIGRVDDFPLGSVTDIELQATFSDPDPAVVGAIDTRSTLEPSSAAVSPVLIFLVHDPEVGFLALYNRDPHLGCRIKWNGAALRFEDPCHGSQYTRTGGYIFGPSPRGLDRFAVVVAEDGSLSVDLAKFQLGPPSSH